MAVIHLLGYFGQRNFGDELANLVCVGLCRERWGAATEFRAINMAAPSDVDITDLLAMYPDGNFRRAWFDESRNKMADAVVVINGGWVHSFCLDVAAQAIDNGVPVYVMSAKNITHMVKGGVCERIMREVVARSDLFICRFAAEAAITGGTDGLDPAEFIRPVPGRLELDQLIYCPRWFEEPSARSESQKLTDVAVECGATLMACTPYDALMCGSYDRIVRAWLEPSDAIHMLANAKAVVSGRLHPAMLACSFGRPAAVLDVTHCPHNRSKLGHLTQEMGVETIRDLAWPEKAPADTFTARAERTLAALTGAGFLVDDAKYRLRKQA